MSLTQKILRDIPGAHKACVASTGLTLSSEAKDFLLSVIGIPAPPVLKLEELTMEMSLSRIVEGLELHHKLLQEIGAVLSSTEELKLLLADVRDLSAQLHEMQRLAQIPSTEYQKVFTLNLNSDYQVRVVAHLTLQQLRSFTQDVFCSLRHIALSN